MKARTGIVFATAGIGTIFGLNELVFKESTVNSQTTTEAINSLIETPYQTTGDQYGLGPVEEPGTWQPSPLTGESTEPWDWGVGYTNEQKEKNRKDAARTYGILDEYSFKFSVPCTSGTGWILDYEIPAEGKYPTKWYIATAAHVVWRLSFSENAYGQLSPKSDTWARNARVRKKDEYERFIQDKGELKTRDKCKASDEVGYLDLNIGQEKTAESRRADVGGVAQKQMKEPKLFYSPFNFLDKEKVGFSNHFADFAVVEIEFEDEEAAKKATNYFADRYNIKTGVAPIKFGKSIEKKYATKDELWKAKDNYYLLAYPVDGKGKWSHSKNWDERTTIASHLSGVNWDSNKENKYRGFFDTKEISVWGTREAPEFSWHGEVFKEFGHRYQFSHNPLTGGASGGLFVDAEGNAIGVAVQASRGQNKIWALPLRSDGVEGDGFKTPKYDLILGAEGQKFSYKSQVQEHILKNNRKTWLSERGKWTPN